ncbi:MAG: hypothetical protein CMF62_12870 [Magnetococcales bacterium]|nr:hypothetical protein [Magnetococcales bacterium]
MLEIATHAALAGFIVATPPGLTQLIAFERTLNRSLLAGWVIALGATCAHLIFAILAVAGISLTSTWVPFGKFAAIILDNKLLILSFLGFMIMLMGLVYLSKKPSPPKTAAKAGFLIGISIPLMDLANLATHTAAVSTNGLLEYTSVQAALVVISLAIGAHISWAWKLGVIYLGKRQLQKRNVQNFNRVFGFMLIGMSISVFIAVGYMFLTR